MTRLFTVVLTRGGRLHRQGKLVIDVHRRSIAWRGCATLLSSTAGATWTWTIVVALLCAHPRPVRVAEIVDLVCSALPDGGPLDPANTVHRTAEYAARHLACLGLAVCKDRKRGWSVSLLQQDEVAA